MTKRTLPRSRHLAERLVSGIVSLEQATIATLVLLSETQRSCKIVFQIYAVAKITVDVVSENSAPTSHGRVSESVGQVLENGMKIVSPVQQCRTVY